MRIALIDVTKWDYTIDTPYRVPLGGSQSALCYLAEQLAKLDEEVWLINHAGHIGVSRGVQCLPMSRVTPDAMLKFDVAVVLNWARVGVDLRRILRPDAKLILWTQHADDQPAMQSLADPTFRDVHDAFVFVSDWQQHRYEEAYHVPSNRSKVLRNAIGPAFENQVSANLLAQKTQPPVLAYTSTPFRGLDVLLDAFPHIRAAVPGITLRVYSSMQVYQAAADRDAAEYGHLYEKCRTTAGVKYIGSLPQPKLAEELAHVSVLAYPNHFPETSCICVMEALASGCYVITSALGALPETTAGFGKLVEVNGDRARYTEQFIATTVQFLQRFVEHPTTMNAELNRQIAFINEHCTWHVRALEWQAWLKSL